MLTTFTTLNTYLPVATCDPNAPISLACVAAISRFCQKSGFSGGGVGPAEHNGDAVVVTCLGSDAAKSKLTQFSTLVSFHGACSAANPLSPFCISAADSLCRSQGYAAGYGPVEANGDSAVVECLLPSFAVYKNIKYQNFRDAGLNCGSANSMTGLCNSAASRNCQANGYAGSTGVLQIGELDANVACLSSNSLGNQSSYIPSGFDLVYGDEFNESELDTSKWWTRYINGGPAGQPMEGTTNFLNGGQERFGENRNHIMTGSALNLTAYGAPEVWEHPSGMIRSKATFKYGYFEARMRLPAAVGVFPAFWMIPDSKTDGTFATWPPEMDFMEYVNNPGDPLTRRKSRSNVAALTGSTQFLYSDDNFVTNDASDPEPHYIAPFNYDEGFHVFGALWDTDDTLSIFIDGKLLSRRAFSYTAADGSAIPYAHLLLDLAVGNYAGKPTTDWNLNPQALEIDYVRVYQRSGQHQLGVSFDGRDLCPAAGGC